MRMSRKSLKKRYSAREGMAKPHNQPGMVQHHRQVITQQYSGIIPNADEMERYNQIEPGFANRILTMTETQLKHRISIEVKQKELEAQAVTASADNMKKRNVYIGRGQIIAFLLCAGALVLGYIMNQTGNSASGATVVGAAFLNLAAAFIFAPRSSSEPPKS